jgi:uncharacterized protein YbjT (DUF2867 family)
VRKIDSGEQHMTFVLVVGATGSLGSQIVGALGRRGARVRALVRSTTGRAEALAAMRDVGVDIVEGSLLDPVDRLAAAVEGAEVIVSAVQGGADVMVDGQVNLVRAAEKAGVARMVPSDFAIDLFRLDDGDNVFLDNRRRAHEAFAGSGVRPTSVLSGAFVEVMTAPFLEIVEWAEGTFGYWGGGEQPCDFTTIADVAEYTVAAALDAGVAGRPVRVAGDVLSMKEFHAALQAGSGRALAPRRLGTVDDLWAEIQRRKAMATSPVEYVALQYLWGMVSGKAKLDRLDNVRYDDIEPITVAKFAQRLA